MRYLLYYSIALGLALALSPTLLDGQEGQSEWIPTGQESRQYDSRALAHYLDADMYMMQGEYKQAAASYALALKYDSSSATIYLGLGEALLQLGKLEHSKDAGQKARRLEPEDPRVYEFLARNAAARENVDEAIQHLDEWAQVDKSDPDPLFRKSGLLLRQKKFAEVVDTYLAIYDRDPLQQQVLARAGEIALSTGDLERAYQVYRRLYQAQPEDPQTARAYAEISLRTKRFNEALEAYESLEKSGQGTLQAKLQLAWLYLRGDSLARAQSLLLPLIDEGYRQWDVLSLSSHLASEMADYQQLARTSGLMREVYPDSIGGYTGLAIANNYLKDEQGAIAVLEEAVARFSANPDVNYLLGNLYFSTERYSDAEHHLRAALEQRPKAGYIQHLLATTWSNMGKYGISDSLYEVVIKASVNDAVALNNYAYSLAERPTVSVQELQYALRLSRKSLKLQPENAAFLDTYGWILYRLERYRSARKYIARSLEIRPDNPIVLEHLGEVYLRLDKGDEAESYFERANQIRQQQEASSMVGSQEE